MPGETDLATLLRDMRPVLDEVPYAVVSVPAEFVAERKPTPLAMLQESEGVTLVLPSVDAERLGLPVDPRWARITLQAHSSLLAVGFLARVAAALARAGISLNPLAGWYHDHLLVPWNDRHRALEALQNDDAAQRKLPAPVDRATAPHYRWGERCDGWHLVKEELLSVIAERMPPGTAEVRHRHHRAEQFFFVLSGELTIEREGAVSVVPAGTGLGVPPGVAHEVRNTSAAAAEFIVVSTPPSHGDREEVPRNEPVCS